MKLFDLFITITVSACTLLSCNKSISPDSKPIIAVSIEPQHYLLDNIVGDSIDIATMLPPNADPENFEPPISTLKQLSNAKAYIAIGNMPFETQLISRSGIASNPSVLTLSFDSLQTITGTHGEGHNHRHVYDPHIWTSLHNCKIMAEQMLSAAIKVDPKNKQYYTSRYNALINRLDSIDSALSLKLAPSRGDIILVQHPSLSYYARDYRLTQIHLGAEHKEITPTQMANAIKTATANGTAATFVSEGDYDSERMQAIAHQAGAKIVTANTIGYDFIDQLTALSNEIAKNHASHDRKQ